MQAMVICDDTVSRYCAKLLTPSRNALMKPNPALLGLLAWDYSGLDLTLAGWFGNAQGFALRAPTLLPG